MPPEASMREAYGKTLVELGQKNPDIVVLDADLARSTMTHYFARQFPDRFFDCGIAEQNMVGIAAGLAASGKIPFASTFAVFAPGRCFDQVRISIAQPRRNVKLVTTHSGISVGEDGSSHQSVEDLALAGSLPGFKIAVPADAVETARVVETAASTEGPWYIRLCRPKTPVIFGEDYCFTLGKAVTLREGRAATIIAIGLMVPAALEAAASLARQGIECRVLNMSTFKPIDEGGILAAARETGALVTAEEHLEHGGLGSVVARVVTRHEPVPLEMVAIQDTYAKSGPPAELMVRYGLSPAHIEQAVLRAIGRKRT